MQNNESYFKIETFKTCLNLFGEDLTLEDSQEYRNQLGLSFEQVLQISDITNCKTLDEYLVELTENFEDFQHILREVLLDQQDSSAQIQFQTFNQNQGQHPFLATLYNLQVECSILHRVACFLKMCFADSISRADLTHPTNKESKLARAIVNLDLLSLAKISTYIYEEQPISIELLVQLFCYREQLIIEDKEVEALKLDQRVFIALDENSDRLDEFWIIIRTMIIERLTRKIIMQRPSLNSNILEQWVYSSEPDYGIFDIPSHSENRVQSIEELRQQVAQFQIKKDRTFGDANIHQILSEINLIHNQTLNQSQSDNNLGSNFLNNHSQDKLMAFTPQNFSQLLFSTEDAQLLLKIKMILDSAQTWLHRDQLLEDYQVYFIMIDICSFEKLEIKFDIAQSMNEGYLKYKSNALIFNQSGLQDDQNQQGIQNKKGINDIQIKQIVTSYGQSNSRVLQFMQMNQQQRLAFSSIYSCDKSFTSKLSQDKQSKNEKQNIPQSANLKYDEQQLILYEEQSQQGFFASIINQRFLQYAQFLNEKREINFTDALKWTPLHMAAFINCPKMVRFLLQDSLCFINEQTALLNQSPIHIALMKFNMEEEVEKEKAANIKQHQIDENIVLQFLQRGAKLHEDLFYKLLIAAINYDRIEYFRIAFNRGLSLHYPLEYMKPSIHKAVCMNAYKILDFYSRIYQGQELIYRVKEPDFQGMNCLDYAKQGKDKITKKLVNEMAQGISLSFQQYDALQLKDNDKDAKDQLILQTLSQINLLQTVNSLKQQLEMANLRQIPSQGRYDQDLEKPANDFRKEIEIEFLKKQLQTQNEMMCKVMEQLEEMRKQQNTIQSQIMNQNNTQIQLSQVLSQVTTPISNPSTIQAVSPLQLNRKTPPITSDNQTVIYSQYELKEIIQQFLDEAEKKPPHTQMQQRDLPSLEIVKLESKASFKRSSSTVDQNKEQKQSQTQNLLVVQQKLQHQNSLGGKSNNSSGSGSGNLSKYKDQGFYGYARGSTRTKNLTNSTLEERDEEEEEDSPQSKQEIILRQKKKQSKAFGFKEDDGIESILELQLSGRGETRPHRVSSKKRTTSEKERAQSIKSKESMKQKLSRELHEKKVTNEIKNEELLIDDDQEDIDISREEKQRDLYNQVKNSYLIERQQRFKKFQFSDESEFEGRPLGQQQKLVQEDSRKLKNEHVQPFYNFNHQIHSPQNPPFMRARKQSQGIVGEERDRQAEEMRNRQSQGLQQSNIISKINKSQKKKNCAIF